MVSISDAEADGFATVHNAVGSPFPPSDNASIAHVDPAGGDAEDELIINEPPRKASSKQKWHRRPHSPKKPAGSEPTPSPLAQLRETAVRVDATGITEGSCVFDDEIIQTQTTRALNTESPVRRRAQVIAADGVQQHSSPLAVEVDSASATRTSPRGFADDGGEQLSVKSSGAFDDDHHGNAEPNDDESSMAADDAPGGDGGETPLREQSIMGADSTAKSDASSERCDPFPQSPGRRDDAKFSTTMQEAYFGQHEGDVIVWREALRPDTPHAGKLVDLEGGGGERRVDSAETDSRSGMDTGLRVGAV